MPLTEKTGERIREVIGGVVVILVGIRIIPLAVLFFFREYYGLLRGFYEADRIGGVIMQSFYQPIFTQIVVLAGVLLIVGGFGFLINRKWAWLVAFIGSIIGVFGSFLLMMFPIMVSEPVGHAQTFLFCGATWVFLVTYVRSHSWQQVVFSLLSGMAMMMTFMNGNASYNKILEGHYRLALANPGIPHVGMIKMLTWSNPVLLYQAVQPILWLAATGFLVVSIATLYRQNWALPIGLAASIISIIAATPVAYVDTIVGNVGERLSMFALAPIISMVVLIILLVFKEKIWTANKPRAVVVEQKTSS